MLQLLIVTLASLFIAVSSAAAEGEPIKLGIILPLTGDMAAVGEAGRDAAQLALSDLKPHLMKQYELVIEDDRLTPTEVAKAAQKLINVDKVAGLISTWSYGGSVVSPLAERAKIPHIGIAWDHHVADGEYNFLHLTPPAEFMKRFLEAFKKLGVTKVALLGMEESGSVFAFDEFIRLAPEYGVAVVYRDSVLFDLKSFDSVVTKIASKQPEYLLFNGSQGLASLLLTSLKRLKAPFRFTAITSFDVLSDLKEIEGLWYVSDSYLPDDFATRFQQHYGQTLRYGVGNFYEATKLLIDAFEKAKDSTSEAVLNQLSQIKNTPSILGPTTVDKEGIFTYPARYMRVRGGKRIPIDLSEITE